MHPDTQCDYMLYVDAIQDQHAKLVEGMKSIAIPDGNIGTTIYKSELERCQEIAKMLLKEIE